jgi:hypothetical protein
MTRDGKEPYAMGLDAKAPVGVTVASISLSLELVALACNAEGWRACNGSH